VGSILVVEGDPDTRGAWTRALEDAGHEVLTADSARDALVALREGGFGAIVIDTFDPRAGVVELARSIEALPDAAPIVLLSGSPHAPEISARIGAAAFLPKPCDSHELVAAVGRLFGQLRPVLVPSLVEDEPTGPVRASSELG
jgi:DNA-binding NtrC family response regulator